MRLSQTAGISRRRFVTTTVRDGGRQAPDLVQRSFTAGAPNVLWVTYIPTWSGFLHLAIVLDAFSRRIVSWSMSLTLLGPIDSQISGLTPMIMDDDEIEELYLRYLRKQEADHTSLARSGASAVTATPAGCVPAFRLSRFSRFPGTIGSLISAAAARLCNSR